MQSSEAFLPVSLGTELDRTTSIISAISDDMRVLILTNAYPSVEKPWEGAAVLLQAEGLRRLGAIVEVLHLERTAKGQKVYLSAYRKIRQRFEEGRFDVLHVHFGGIQALLGATVARHRCVITYHGTDLHGGKPRTIEEKVSYAVGVWCSKLASRLGGAAIVVSGTLLPCLGARHCSATVIPTGVDYQRFVPMDRFQARRDLGLDQDSRWILFCDNNRDPIKRLDLAERAIDELKGDFPDAQLLILNHVPFDLVPLYLNAAEALLVTSDKEGSPNIVKEAIACNLPVVSVDVGDVPEMISGLKHCNIAERDPRSLSAALKHALLRSGGENGREIKKVVIDNDRLCRAILDVYRAVVKSDE